jgi:serine/threonine protein kinase
MFFIQMNANIEVNKLSNKKEQNLFRMAFMEGDHLEFLARYARKLFGTTINAKSFEFLGEGSFNEVYKIKNTNFVIRFNQFDMPLEDCKKEAELGHFMSKHGIGPPILKSVIIDPNYRDRPSDPGAGFLVTFMQLADSTLGDAIRISKVSPETLARSLFTRIRKLYDLGYMFTDIKPQNILVVGDQVYLNDFQAAFTTKPGEKYHKKSERPIQILNGRLMIFLLVRVIDSWYIKKQNHVNSFQRFSTELQRLGNIFLKKAVHSLPKRIVNKNGKHVQVENVVKDILKLNPFGNKKLNLSNLDLKNFYKSGYV